MDTTTTLHSLWRECNLAANVHRLFWKHCQERVAADKGTSALEAAYREKEQFGIRRKGKLKKRRKLMEMEREPSLRERLDAMKNSKLRKYGVKEQMRQFYQ